LEALHLQDGAKTKELLKELKKHHKGETTPKKSKAKEAGSKRERDPEDDIHELDAQIRGDIDMLNLPAFAVEDLRSLCVHHKLSSEGTRPVLVDTLEAFYKQPADKKTKQ
jgi:hypothetical protein